MVASATTREQSFNDWPVGVRHKCSEPDSIYHGYPYLFLQAFPNLTIEQAEPLARATGLIFDAIIVADRIMDEETDQVTASVLRVEAMLFEGYRLLHPLISPESSFWERYRDYLIVYSQACLTERRLASPEASWVDFTDQAAVSVAAGKCGIAKIAVDGLAALAGDTSNLQPLTRSIELYYTARQMLDDLTDWREDLESGFPSLLLSRVVASAFDGDRAQMQAESKRTQRELYYGGHVRYTMQLASQAIAESDRLTADFPDLLWRRQTTAIRERCEAVLKQVEHIDGSRQTITRRLAVALPPPSNAWQEVAWAAVERLLTRWGATGAQLPSSKSNDVTSKVGDSLPLALIADALCDVDLLLEGQLQPLIQSQADYLVYRRRHDDGWSYSAVSLDLPPDTDHLGLVMRTLLRAHRQEDVEQHCSILLSRLLEHDVLQESGGAEIWIRRRLDDPTPWSGEPDAAVTAQLLEALAMSGQDRFGDAIQRGLTWLEGCQHTDGSWHSPAYQGPYYATAACLRCLVALRPQAEAIGKADSFLRFTRRDTSDWGLDGAPSDSMSTALALQGLAMAQNSATSAEDFEHAKQALQGIQRAGHGGDLTTAFTLRAAVLWNHLAAAATSESAEP